MKALVFVAAGVVELRDVPEPVPKAGEVVVDVVVSGICGSDIHGVASPGFRVPPLILGHEVAGRLDGRPVAVNPLSTCMTCARCLEGATSLCPDRELLGVHRAGGLAERVAVPSRSVVEIAEPHDWRTASAIEPAASVVHALRIAAADLHPGCRVAILGAGPIGLLALQLLRRMDIQDVWVTDLSPHRLAVAAELGSRGPDMEIDGGFDVVVDAAGTGRTRAESVRLLRPGGHAVWVGLADAVAGFDATELVRQGKRVSGCFAYTHDDFLAATDVVDALTLTWIDLLPLSHGVEEFDEFLSHNSPRLKAVFKPGSHE
jgi:threonine dehydrogenase-like Zn-dependent dehydrogenase